MAVPPLFLAQHLVSRDFPSARTWGWTLLALAVVISLLSFNTVFSPASPSLALMPFPSERVQPIQRQDLDAIKALMQFVGDKVVEPGQPPVADVYLLSSSHLFNSTQLASAGFQLHEPLPAEDYISTTHDLDRRDGFPDALVTAKVVLVAAPLQTHLNSEQKVLSVPVREFLQDESFAHAFARDPQSFQLDEGVRVYVFERVRPSTPEEVEELHQQIGLPSKGSTL